MTTSDIVALRPVETRIEPCVMCGKNVRFDSCTAPDDECPEMMRFPQGTWVGVLDDGAGMMTMAICCSEDCMRALVR